MDGYDDSDCCRRCGELFTVGEVRRYRDDCNTDGAEMPAYCDECLDQTHVLEPALDVPDAMWTKEQWWKPGVRREKQGMAGQG